MKNKLLSSVLISMAFPVCGNAAPVTGDELNIGTGNVVLAGSKSGAVGENNDVSFNSMAIGTGNTADDHSLAMGYYNSANLGSFAGGQNAIMDANTAGSLIYGDNIRMGGGYAAVVFGWNHSVNWDSAANAATGGAETGLLIAGTSNTVIRGGGQWGYDNILLGINNRMDASLPGSDSTMRGSALIGISNTTSKTESWAIGKGNIGQTGAVTLGTYGSVVAEPASLIVGTGSANANRSNGLVVLKSGVVQIPGSLEIGGVPALTETSAETAGYLKKISGGGATGGSSALLVRGNNATAPINGLALGNYAAATGVSSFAIGFHSKAAAQNSYAFGRYAEASASDAMALGYMSTSSGEYSTAIGPNAKSVGEHSIALGGDALGFGSLALRGGRANADYSTASMGGTASGFGSIAIAAVVDPYVDGTATASGAAATAIGGQSPLASGDLSFTSGYQTTSSAAHSTAFGSRNLSRGTGLVPADTTSWVETDALFELGNGKPGLTPAQYSNAITTLKNGRTTLSNKFWVSTTPEVVPAATDASAGAALVVEGHAELKGNTVLDGKTRLKGTVVMDQAQGDISMGIYE